MLILARVGSAANARLIAAAPALAAALLSANRKLGEARGIMREVLEACVQCKLPENPDDRCLVHDDLKAFLAWTAPKPQPSPGRAR